MTAVTNLRFQPDSHAHNVVSTMGVHLQQLIPAIANKTVQATCKLDSALLELFVLLFHLQYYDVSPDGHPGRWPTRLIFLESFLNSFLPSMNSSFCAWKTQGVMSSLENSVCVQTVETGWGMLC